MVAAARAHPIAPAFPTVARADAAGRAGVRCVEHAWPHGHLGRQHTGSGGICGGHPARCEVQKGKTRVDKRERRRRADEGVKRVDFRRIMIVVKCCWLYSN